MIKRIAALILAMLSLFACVGFSSVSANEGAGLPILEISTQGFESAYASADGSLIAAESDGKWGLVDSKGEVLVDFVYDNALGMPSSEGYTVFHSLNMAAGASAEERCTASYLFDGKGKLVLEAYGEYFAGVSEGKVLSRSGRRSMLSLGSSGSSKTEYSIDGYKVKYYDLEANGKVIFVRDGVTASTAFRGGAAFVSTLDKPGENLISEIIKIKSDGSTVSAFGHEPGVKVENGAEVPFNYPVRLIGVTDEGRAVVGSVLRFSESVAVLMPENASSFAINHITDERLYKNVPAPIMWTGRAYNFITEDGTYLFSAGGKQIIAMKAFDTLDELQAWQGVWGDRIPVMIYDIMTGDAVGSTYTHISYLSYNKYLLAGRVDGSFGYVDLSGKEYGSYKDAGDFVGGRALVMDDVGRALVINEEFKTISESVEGYDGVSECFVRKDGRLHLITNFNDIPTETEEKEDNKFILTIGKKEALVFGEIKINDVEPVIRNNRTMLPARFVSENLGGSVGWDGEKRLVTVTKGKTKIEIYIGSSTAYVNGEAHTLDSPAFVENNRTYTPVRFICEKLGAEVFWDKDERRVIITAQ